MIADCMLDTNVLVYAVDGTPVNRPKKRLHARTLYTEDLNHGQRYGSVTVINPFSDHG